MSVPNTGLSITDPQTGEVFDLSGIFASLAPGAQGAFAAGVAGINGGTTPAPTPAPVVPSTPVSVPNTGLSITDPQTGEVFDLSGIFASLAPGAQGAFAAGVAGINGGATPAPAPTPAPVVPSTPVSSPNTGLTITDPETGEVFDLSGIFASLAPGAQGAFAAGVAGVNGGRRLQLQLQQLPLQHQRLPIRLREESSLEGQRRRLMPIHSLRGTTPLIRSYLPETMTSRMRGFRATLTVELPPIQGVSFNRAYLQGDIGGAYLTFQVGRDVQNGVPFEVAAARAVAAYPF